MWTSFFVIMLPKIGINNVSHPDRDPEPGPLDLRRYVGN
jgi:hypothetical protein